MKTLAMVLATSLASVSFAAGTGSGSGSAATAPAGTSSMSGTPGAAVNTTNPDTNRIPATNTYGTLPPTTTGDRATTYPESTATGQTNPPTTTEVQRQRNEMNRQRNQMKNQADCSTVTDTAARANCESKSRSL